MSRELELFLAISRGEAIALLEEATDKERWSPFSTSGYTGRKPFLSSIKDTRFRIQKRRSGKNGFAPHLIGSVDESPDGSVIHAHFALQPATRIGLAVYLAFTVLAPVALAVLRPSQESTALMGAGLLVAALGVAIALVGIATGRHEKHELRAFVTELFERFRMTVA